MFCNNYIGKYVPLFVIIPDLENGSFEDQTFIQSGLFWACSTASGWEARNSFIFWVLNFNWLSEYRLSLDPALRNQKAVLILDGHNSRENPLAIKSLKQNNVEVVILPAHTTHFLQMLDVVLAFTNQRMISFFYFEQFQFNRNRLEAARKTGTVPANAEIILQNIVQMCVPPKTIFMNDVISELTDDLQDDEYYSGPFTKDEDEIILQSYVRYGSRLALIAKKASMKK